MPKHLMVADLAFEMGWILLRKSLKNLIIYSMLTIEVFMASDTISSRQQPSFHPKIIFVQLLLSFAFHCVL